MGETIGGGLDVSQATVRKRTSRQKSSVSLFTRKPINLMVREAAL